MTSREQAVESIQRVGLMDLRTARSILDALLAARVPCPTCGGTGYADTRHTPPNYDGSEPCAACHGDGHGGPLVLLGGGS